MTFCMSLLLQPIARNEMSRYMVRGLDCVVACGVLVQANYIANTVAHGDMSDNSIYAMFRCDIAMCSFLDSGRI